MMDPGQPALGQPGRGRSEANSPDQEFAAFLKEGRFMLQRCLADGRYWFYPRVLCPHCGSSEYEWSEVSGDGAVYSTTVVRRKAEEGGDHNIALVDDCLRQHGEGASLVSLGGVPEIDTNPAEGSSRTFIVEGMPK